MSGERYNPSIHERRRCYHIGGERHLVTRCKYCGYAIGWGRLPNGRPYPCVLVWQGQPNAQYSKVVATGVRHECPDGRGPKGKCAGYDPMDSSGYCRCGHSFDYHSEETDLCLVCPSRLPSKRTDGKCAGYQERTSGVKEFSCTCGHALDMHDPDSRMCLICPPVESMGA
jgi:hypothetical protein